MTADSTSSDAACSRASKSAVRAAASASCARTAASATSCVDLGDAERRLGAAASSAVPAAAAVSAASSRPERRRGVGLVERRLERERLRLVRVRLLLGGGRRRGHLGRALVGLDGLRVALGVELRARLARHLRARLGGGRLGGRRRELGRELRDVVARLADEDVAARRRRRRSARRRRSSGACRGARRARRARSRPSPPSWPRSAPNGVVARARCRRRAPSRRLVRLQAAPCGTRPRASCSALKAPCAGARARRRPRPPSRRRRSSGPGARPRRDRRGAARHRLGHRAPRDGQVDPHVRVGLFFLVQVGQVLGRQHVRVDHLLLRAVGALDAARPEHFGQALFAFVASFSFHTFQLYGSFGSVTVCGPERAGTLHIEGLRRRTRPTMPMSINHPDEKTGLLSAPPRTDASVRSAFFVLGAGSTITFNAAVMAVGGRRGDRGRAARERAASRHGSSRRTSRRRARCSC